jgi:hypothetical protein
MLRNRLPATPSRRVLVILGVVIAVGILAVVVSHMLDEPLRRTIESRLNQNLNGYHVQLEHAHFGLVSLSLALSNLSIRQTANPEPPVALFHGLDLHLDWAALRRLHLAGEAVFDKPQIHVVLPQLRSEVNEKVSPKDRGWQQALESIFPWKFNQFTVHDGSIVYVDTDPRYPLTLTHLNLSASNIRNIASPSRVYPSDFHTDAVAFDRGKVTVDGKANFLAIPYPGVKSSFQLEGIPLDRLGPIAQRADLEVKDGELSTHGDLEFAPGIRRVELPDVRLDRVRVDYIHAATAAAEKDKPVASTTQKAADSPVSLRLDALHLVNSEVGLVDRSQKPGYRLYVANANLEVKDLANRAGSSQRPASAHLTGKFMGSGTTKVSAVFRPQSAAASFGAEVAIDNVNLLSLNELLQSSQNLRVKSGTVSIYSQITVANDTLDGYVKPLFRDVEIDESVPQPTLGSRIKQKAAAVVAKVLKNRQTDQVATRTAISGKLGDSKTSLSETVFELLRNAFIQPLRTGFEQTIHRKSGKQ